MNNMHCQIESHNGQKIITVCLDKQCKCQQRLCCLQCLIQSHSAHQKQSVDIDQINFFINKEYNKEVQNISSQSFGQKYIIQDLEQLITLIDSLQKAIEEKIQKIKQENLQEYLKKNMNEQEGSEQWNHLIEGILQYVQVDNCIINLISHEEEGRLNEMEEREINFIKQSEQSLQSIINQITQPQITYESPLQIQMNQPTQIENIIQMNFRTLSFKENRKHADIAIISESIIQKTKATSSYAMAFADEGFNPNNQSYAFGFIILNQIGGIKIGVGNSEKGQQHSYILNHYTTLGHGQYMIHCYTDQEIIETFTLHHTDQKINNRQREGLTFKTGDKIQIKYDHVTKMLKFRNSKNDVFKMPITDMTKILYPCAELDDPGDSIQLVDY